MLLPNWIATRKNIWWLVLIKIVEKQSIGWRSCYDCPMVKRFIFLKMKFSSLLQLIIEYLYFWTTIGQLISLSREKSYMNQRERDEPNDALNGEK